MRVRALFLIVFLVLATTDTTTGAEPVRTRVRVVTANIYAGLPPTLARADLRLAMDGADVVLTQEMYVRRMDVPGWGRYQPVRRPNCRELATYWRTDVWRFRYAWTVVLNPGPWRFPHSVRCATVVRLQNRVTGAVFGFVNLHMIPHVETAGRPRPLPFRIRVYATSMRRLDRMTENVSPTVVGADWNVNCATDRVARYAGFPWAHLHDDYRDACTGAPTLPGRHVDTVWTRSCRVDTTTTILGTRSDHNFSRVVAECVPW